MFSFETSKISVSRLRKFQFRDFEIFTRLVAKILSDRAAPRQRLSRHLIRSHRDGDLKSAGP